IITDKDRTLAIIDHALAVDAADSQKVSKLEKLKQIITS
ncbi:MAG: hypothetical protein QG639_536, partial [Patescibacteria group bacterium]|nr:hypothetical protein [Patescibacteria group bacterium]